MNGGPAPALEPRAFAVVAYPRWWRVVAALLRVVACGSFVWALFALLWSDNPPTNPLRQIRLFVAFYAAPGFAAWCIARAYAATARVEGGVLRIDQGDRAWEIPAASVAGVALWRLPLPRPGLRLRLKSGRFFERTLETRDPDALVAALEQQGAPSLRDGLDGRLEAYLRALAGAARGRLDHPLLKFGVYSLVPTVPAHRLHQFITFGGWTGEYLTFGLKAYVTGFALWWASWTYHVIVIAVALRLAVEPLALLAALASPALAVPARLWLERAQRLLYYAGIPTFLLIRFTA